MMKHINKIFLILFLTIYCLIPISYADDPTVQITSPVNNGFILNNLINIQGSAFGTNFSYYRLTLDSNIIVDHQTTAVNNGVLGQIDGSLLDPSTMHTLQLTVFTTDTRQISQQAIFRIATILPGWPTRISPSFDIYDINSLIVSDLYRNSQKSLISGGSNLTRCMITALGPDGNTLTGWPFETPGKLGNLSVGNVSGDNKPEIIANLATSDFVSHLYVFDHEGQVLAGWPKDLGSLYALDAMSVGDLDNSGLNKIILTKSLSDSTSQEVDVFNGDGTMFSGWPRLMPLLRDTSTNAKLILAVGDVVGDSNKEIILASKSRPFVGTNYLSRITILDKQGNLINTLDIAGQIVSDIILGDIDHDGHKEIIFGVNFASAPSKVYVLKPDGTSLSGFPASVPYKNPLGLAVADFNGNGMLSIVVSTTNYPATQNSTSVTVFEHNGLVRSGWPYTWVNQNGSGAETLTIADLNGDGRLEIVLKQRRDNQYPYQHKFFLFNDNGVPLPGFPLDLGDAYGDYGTVITDINNDGKLDVLMPIINNSVTAISFFNNNYDPLKIFWPQKGFDAGHSYDFNLPQPNALPPVFDLINDQQALSTAPLNFIVRATDPQNSHLTLSAALSNGDPLSSIGARFTPDNSAGTGVFTWIPSNLNQSGMYPVTFTVQNDLEQQAQRMVTITLFSKANLISPMIGPLASTTQFQWTPSSSSATYKLQLGTRVGGSDIFNGELTTQNSIIVNGIPKKDPIYVRLTTYIGSLQAYNEYVIMTPTIRKR